VWHRTGDLARRDGEGRLWLLGRRGDTVVHRGRDRYPFEIEAAALDVNGVWRAALVAHARAPEGELAVQLAPDAQSSAVSAALGDLLAEHEMPAIAVRVLATIPMDARHESKVERRALAAQLER
jgi:acyl-coenzyme A synthetase/AMP-(fatty) acid ligase